VIEVDGLEYAQARLSARNGERPDEVEWRHMAVVRELAGSLDAARQTRLRRWTADITPQDRVHEIEATLRRHWRKLVAEVAGWMPAEWRAAVAWCGALADLPPLQYLARGGPVLAWMRDDPVYRDLCTDQPGAGPAALVTGPLAPLLPAWADPDRFLTVWSAEWVRRLPRGSLGATPLLERLATGLEQHLAAFGGATPSDGWALRRALQLRVASLFRRAMLDPTAAFAFLALTALDIERLRGELVRRAAFPRSPLAA
jgi:hypothetical protein